MRIREFVEPDNHTTEQDEQLLHLDTSLTRIAHLFTTGQDVAITTVALRRLMADDHITPEYRDVLYMVLKKVIEVLHTDHGAYEHLRNTLHH